MYWPGYHARRVSEPLRIALVGPGRSIHTKRWARRLADRGHEVHLFTEAPEPVPGVEVHDILGKGIPGGVGIRKLWRRRYLRRTLDDLDPDVLHAHFLFPYGEWAWRTGRRPLLHQAWGSDVLVIPERSADRREWAERLLRDADAVTVNSLVLRDAVVRLGAPADRVREIGWGVDTARFSGVHDRSVVDGLGLEGRPVVASPRLHKELYNLDVLMDAVPLVQRGVPDAAFLFMADGPDTDALRARAERLGVSGSVRFARFDEEDVPAAFAGCELSVSIPSSDSGRPSSLLEAMASALPVVVSDVPGIRELIDQGDGAEIVPLRDAEATAAAITGLLTDDGLRKRMGARNREVVRERADAARETDRCIDLYRRLSAHGPLD
jgi:glycosyltransferase involved in cell wall biosynthesis